MENILEKAKKLQDEFNLSLENAVDALDRYGSYENAKYELSKMFNKPIEEKKEKIEEVPKTIITNTPLKKLELDRFSNKSKYLEYNNYGLNENTENKFNKTVKKYKNRRIVFLILDIYCLIGVLYYIIGFFLYILEIDNRIYNTGLPLIPIMMGGLITVAFLSCLSHYFKILKDNGNVLFEIKKQFPKTNDEFLINLFIFNKGNKEKIVDHLNNPTGKAIKLYELYGISTAVLQVQSSENTHNNYDNAVNNYNTHKSVEKNKTPVGAKISLVFEFVFSAVVCLLFYSGVSTYADGDTSDVGMFTISICLVLLLFGFSLSRFMKRRAEASKVSKAICTCITLAPIACIIILLAVYQDACIDFLKEFALYIAIAVGVIILINVLAKKNKGYKTRGNSIKEAETKKTTQKTYEEPTKPVYNGGLEKLEYIEGIGYIYYDARTNKIEKIGNNTVFYYEFSDSFIIEKIGGARVKYSDGYGRIEYIGSAKIQYDEYSNILCVGNHKTKY